MTDKLIEITKQIGFTEHPYKPGLYKKEKGITTTIYIDFRKTIRGHAYGFEEGEPINNIEQKHEEIKKFKQMRNAIENRQMKKYEKKQDNEVIK